MTCFVCGSENVEAQESMDIFCTMAPTTDCRCPDCGAQWFDDTACTQN